MRGLGFGALAFALLSLLLWLIYWGLLVFVIPKYGYQGTTYWLMQGSNAASSVTEYLSIILVAFGLVVAANRIKTTPKE